MSSSSSSTKSKASSHPHYATFATQQKRLARLQEAAAEQEAEARRTSAAGSMVASVTAAVKDFFQSMCYRMATACLPCFELASALNLHLPRRRRARADGDGDGDGDDGDENGVSGGGGSRTAKPNEDECLLSSCSTGTVMTTAEEKQTHSRLSPSPSDSVIQSPTPPPRRKPGHDHQQQHQNGRNSPSSSRPSRPRGPAPKGRKKPVVLANHGRVSSEMTLGSRGRRQQQQQQQEEAIKEQRSHSLTNSSPGPLVQVAGARKILQNDLELSSSNKSGSPSPLITHRDLRESSVCSRSSMDDYEDQQGHGHLQGGRDERHPSPFNKLHGSMSSLGSRSESMLSVYSQDGGRYGTVTVRGDVEFGLLYNVGGGTLELAIKQCRDLAPVDTKRNRSDPYVKVYLLPDKSKSGKRKTKVKKHTLNPVFDETLKFQLPLNEVERRSLWLTVWHSDMFGRNDFLGEVTLPMAGQPVDDPTTKWFALQDRSETPGDEMATTSLTSPTSTYAMSASASSSGSGHFRGELILAMKFVPPPSTSASGETTYSRKSRKSKGVLMVLIKEAKNLVSPKGTSTVDSFCKCYLLPEKSKSSKQKTGVCRRTLSPKWEHTLTWESVSLYELADRSLELSVWDHDRLGHNEVLGGVRLNLGNGKHQGRSCSWMDSTGKEVTLWQQMLDRPNFWVEGAVDLRSNERMHSSLASPTT